MLFPHQTKVKRTKLSTSLSKIVQGYQAEISINLLPEAISDNDKHSPGENSSIWVCTSQESESFYETGGIAQWLAYLLREPAALVSIPIILEIFPEEKIVAVAEVYQLCCLEESEQWLENVS